MKFEDGNTCHQFDLAKQQFINTEEISLIVKTTTTTSRWRRSNEQRNVRHVY